MATYKRIVDVETVAEATETMNVLVEDAGTLKKVSMENIGGGNGNFLVIEGTMSSSVAPTAAASPEPDTFTPNMTFGEFSEHIVNGTLAGIFMNFKLDGELYIYQGTYIYLDNIPDYINFNVKHPNNGTLYLVFNSNNTIEQQAKES